MASKMIRVCFIRLNNFDWNLGATNITDVNEQSTEWPFPRSFRVIEPAAAPVIIFNCHQGLGAGDYLLIFDSAYFYKNH